MSFVQPPSPKPSDDFDALLRAFFRRQMPQPWPALSLPSSPAAPLKHPSASGRNLIRGRWVLAASVALLLLGSLLLPARFPHEAKPEQIISAPTADSNILPKRSKRTENKANENKNKSGLAADDGDQLPEVDDSDMSLLK